MNIASHMEAVARHLFGDPDKEFSQKGEWRYGNRGSLKIDIKKGVWHDFETDEKGGVLRLIERERKFTNGQAIEWLKTELGIALSDNSRQPIATYPYTDEAGNILFEVVRYEPKDFLQRRPDGRGGWIWKLDGVRQVPFHLPQLLAANNRAIHIVEGEKDVFALERIGLVATCNAGGACKWRAEFSKYFAAADVAVFPDNDPGGEDHANQVAGMLRGTASRVRIVHLPGLPPKGDVSDWIAAGGTVEKLAQLCEGAEEHGPKSGTAASFNLVSAADLVEREFKPPKWAVPDLVPEGLSILAGKPKTGKSWLALDMAIAVAGGTYALCNVKCEPGEVLFLALEDTERRLHSRIKAVLQGAKAPRALSIATQWRRADEGGLDDLRTWLSQHPSARLVIVDTLQKIRGARKRDAGVYEDDYRAVAELKKLADEFTVPTVLVHHLNKEGNADPIMAVSGTAGITGSADTILVLAREPNDLNALLYVRGRDVNEAEIAIKFDSETGKWLRLGKGQDWRISEERRAIIKVMIDIGPMTPREIADATGKKPGAVRMALRRMLKDGDISQLNDGRYSP